MGRGLNALLSEMTASNNEEFKEIEIDLIEPNNLQPRTKFDENKLNELALSIKENGVVQPILVRRITNGRYQIVAGERRWRAAQRAGLQQISAIIRDIADDKMLELALVENIQRQELNAIEEAYAYKRLIDTLGLTQETVAQRVGRDRTFVTNYLRLLRLPEDIQELVEENKISMGHARALLGVDDPNKQREVAKNIIGTGLSVRDTERAIKRLINGYDPAQITKKSAETGDIYTRQAEAKLRRKLGTQVKIIRNTGKEGGKIEIHYYNETDLQRIYELLSPINPVEIANGEASKT